MRGLNFAIRFGANFDRNKFKEKKVYKNVQKK